ncbi:MAG TPA: hypothetical protein VMZ53_06240 [Kofleriaceae bacterium]|nr:hypothetical protein [Kofleriaceae bacterium]
MWCRRIPNTACVLAILATVLAASPAYGQEAGAQAEALFREGRELLAAGRIPQACSAFEQSQKLEPATTTLLNLAGCRELNRQYASAWGYFLQAERETRNSADPDRIKLHAIAETRAATLEAKVSRLTINVSAESRIEALEVLRGATVVEASAWNRALPVDGGTYTLTARARGATPWTTTVTVGAEADSKTIAIPKLQPAPVEPESDEDGEGEPEQLPPAPPRSLVLPIAFGAGAVAMLGGAVAFELSAEATFEQSQAEPNPTTSDILFAKANHRRYAAEALAVTGLAAGGVAVWLYLRTPRDAASSGVASRSVHVVPTVSAAYSGFEMRGSF